MSPRALLASPLGFLIGVSLGALGGGGSILAVPALVYAAGETTRAATTTSLLVVGATAVGGMVTYLRSGQVRVVAGLLFGLTGIGGSLIGSHLNESVDPDVLLLAFAGLMAVAAWRMWASESKRVRAEAAGLEAEHPIDPVLAFAEEEAMGVDTATRTLVTAEVAAKVLVAGTVVGFMTGFFGVGGGFVIVPALVLVLDFDMTEAVGTSLLVIAINSAVALAMRAGSTGIDWGVALPFTIAGLLGVATGKKIADRVPKATLVRWFVGLLIVLAAYIATRSILALT